VLLRQCRPARWARAAVEARACSLRRADSAQLSDHVPPTSRPATSAMTRAEMTAEVAISFALGWKPRDSAPCMGVATAFGHFSFECGLQRRQDQLLQQTTWPTDDTTSALARGRAPAIPARMGIDRRRPVQYGRVITSTIAFFAGTFARYMTPNAMQPKMYQKFSNPVRLPLPVTFRQAQGSPCGTSRTAVALEEKDCAKGLGGAAGHDPPATGRRRLGVLTRQLCGDGGIRGGCLDGAATTP
jgi:hypothetical protein